MNNEENFSQNSVKDESTNILAARTRFSAEEDAKLVRLQQLQLDWKEISRRIGNRSARQCRERFQNYLNPDLNKSDWTPDEDNLLLKKEEEMGKKWKKMMPYFQNRSNVNIKNRFTTLQNRKKANEKRGDLIQISKSNNDFFFDTSSLYSDVKMQRQIPQSFNSEIKLSPVQFERQFNNNNSIQNVSQDYFSFVDINSPQKNVSFERQFNNRQFQLKKQAQNFDIQQSETKRNQEMKTRKEEQINKMMEKQNVQSKEEQIQQNNQNNYPKVEQSEHEKLINEIFDDDQEIRMMWNFLDSDIGQKNTFF